MNSKFYGNIKSVMSVLEIKLMLEKMIESVSQKVTACLELKNKCFINKLIIATCNKLFIHKYLQ